MFVHLHSSPLVVRQTASLPKPLNPAHPFSFSLDLQPIEILDVKEERRLLLQCLQECNKQVCWRSEVADVHTFRKVISYGCRALHFSGHGVPGKVIFENGTCEAHFLSQQELKTLLLAGVQGTSPENTMRLVFVSACHSESVAEAFVSAGVPHVVVVPKEDKVLDQKAMEFSKAFYTALLAGHSVYKAFEIGQVQADIVSIADHHQSKFKLLGNGDHARSHLFSDLALGKYQDLTPPLPINECDAVAEVFVGRSIEVHACYTALVEGARMVCLTGPAGIGKTEVALQTCQYATDRYLFARIFFLRFALATTPSSLSLRQYLMGRLAKSFNVPLSDETDVDSDEALEKLTDRIRDKLESSASSQSTKYLLVMDGCNALFLNKALAPGLMPQLRSVISQLLRRVRSLSLLLTSDSRLGGGTGMDCGVGERIIPIEHLPPMDAALLFTVRAPRRLQIHEMGGDLHAFSRGVVMDALGGHPRTICAVAQLLEVRDLQRDEREFLHYLIPSVIAGLDPSSKQDLANDYCPLLPYGHARHPHGLVKSASSRVASAQMDPTPLRKHGSFLDRRTDAGGTEVATGGMSPQQLLVFAVRQHARAHISSPEGCVVWAHAVVEYEASTPHVDGRRTTAVPFELLAQQISRFFASKVRQAAVERPLSSRCMEFLASSSLIWGAPGRCPKTKENAVDVAMFAAFWSWFEPLIVCIQKTNVWAFKHPRLLHGFISKEASKAMLLATNAPGTFLLRFSETRQSCLVVAYLTASLRVEFVPIEFNPISSTFEMRLQDEKARVVYPSLSQLVLSIHVLTCIYPSTPKALVFHKPELAQQ
ncbi:hypothetical protein SDRG_08366 [Saprolegnia diclina VS20]|uniref:SH2 domain-containing protein n=1 Tax=Saprolegnia diclina (strain VS20) TaxID=1156394 RepID=T0RP06_SAPDV|nr:hypothetical protein SDRG_08366 [Saprolegnia diclina VS20]EQC34158.1 hypothetical protein SDRG_08366 [Saprolegnia diclina VS20]|eukprot:XP_008612470.1 hypothetical protein SDRG_08366 [Saprolegnia diclina VS20]